MEDKLQKQSFLEFKIKSSFLESQSKFRPQAELLQLFRGLDFHNSYLQVFFPSVKIYPKEDELVFLYKIVCGVNKRGKWADIENLFLNLLVFAFSYQEQVTPLSLSQEAWNSIGKYLIKNWRFCRYKWVVSYAPELQNLLWREIQQETILNLQQKMDQLGLSELTKAELSKQINQEQLNLQEVDLGVTKSENHKDSTFQLMKKQQRFRTSVTMSHSSNKDEKFRYKFKVKLEQLVYNNDTDRKEDSRQNINYPDMRIQKPKLLDFQNLKLVIIKKKQYQYA